MLESSRFLAAWESEQLAHAMWQVFLFGAVTHFHTLWDVG